MLLFVDTEFTGLVQANVLPLLWGRSYRMPIEELSAKVVA